MITITPGRITFTDENEAEDAIRAACCRDDGTPANPDLAWAFDSESNFAEAFDAELRRLDGEHGACEIPGEHTATGYPIEIMWRPEGAHATVAEFAAMVGITPETIRETVDGIGGVEWSPGDEYDDDRRLSPWEVGRLRPRLELVRLRQTMGRRDDLIRAAAAVGVSEAEIARTSGLSRMTVRKALGK